MRIVSTAIGATPFGFGAVPRHLRDYVTFEEEEGEDAGSVGSWSKQPDEEDVVFRLLPQWERDVVDRFDKRGRRLSSAARSARHANMVLSIISICAAAAVPVFLAVGLPPWMSAVLGGITTVAQGINQLTHSAEKSAELHTTLLKMTDARDRLRSDLRNSKGRAERTALVNAYELELVALNGGLGDRIAEIERSGAKQ